jgi:hypothetical protein
MNSDQTFTVSQMIRGMPENGRPQIAGAFVKGLFGMVNGSGVVIIR